MKKHFILLGLVLILGLAFCIVYTPGLAATGIEEMVSGAGSATVYGPSTVYMAPDASGWDALPAGPAVLAWVHPFWPSIDGSTAQWISNTDYVQNPTITSWRKFHIEFDIPVASMLPEIEIKVNADDGEEVWVNGTLLGSN